MATLIALGLLLPAGQAHAKGYGAGYYSGRTSQGPAISFVVADGEVSELLAQITDTCSPGTFSFDVSTNTLLPSASGGRPFSTVCAMLYSGTPATLSPSRNVALATARGPLVPGPGAPDTQP